MTTGQHPTHEAALAPATVVLATKDRPADLVRAMTSLQELDYPGLSILVIDQSADPSPALPAGPHPVRLVRQEAAGKSRALNLALREAADGILLFTDDDCTVPPGWAAAMARRLTADERCGLVFSRVEPAPHDPRVLFIPDFLVRTEREFTSAWRGRRFGGLGASMAARRSVLIAAGGFDERLGPGSHFGNSEDTDIAYRVLRGGHTVVHTPITGVTHYGGRPYAGGAAREIVVRSYFSFGAMCARSARSGDPVALLTLAVDLTDSLVDVARNALHRRKPLGIRRTTALLRGAWAGLRDGSPRQGPATRVKADRPSPFPRQGTAGAE